MTALPARSSQKFFKKLFVRFFKFHLVTKPDLSCACLIANLIGGAMRLLMNFVLICVNMICCRNNVLITDPAGVL